MASTSAQFLELLERSRLLRKNRMDAAREAAVQTDNPAALARALTERGWLTRWQAQQMLAGHWQFFLGKYKLLDALGRGGMGTVYKAVQPGLGRLVALKVMSSNMLKDEAAVTRFRREMLAVGALNHPNIVVAHDSDSVGDTHFLVMECVEGLNVKEWIRDHSPLPVGWCCEVIRQAAEGLHHAHGLGLIHRDIKPSNLLIVGKSVQERPMVKILDMGLARFATQTSVDEEAADFSLGIDPHIRDATMTLAGQIMGSPLYIAPEQAHNSRLADGRADVYGLGVTLFEMLTGEPPFHRENVLETIRAKMMESAPLASTLRPGIPDLLDQLLNLMLAADPAHRIQTPREVADALSEFTGFVEDESKGEQAWQNTRKHARKTAGGEETLANFLDQIDTSGGDSGTIADRVHIRRSDSKRALWIGAGATAGIIVLALSIYFAYRPNDESALGDGQSDVAGQDDDSSEPVSSTPQRTLVEWVLKSGGVVSVRAGDQLTRLIEATALPRTAFDVVEVDLEGFIEIPADQWQVLVGLSSIESLNLKGTRITDADLRSLTTLTQLKNLNLSLVQGITDAGIQSLGRLKSLRELDLNFTACSDKPLAALAELDQLTYLNLGLSQVSDAGIDELSKLTSLKVLDVRDCQITPAGKARLRESLSGCRIQ